MGNLICNRCILDSSTPNIYFNSEGNCNYCCEFVDLLTNKSLHANSIHRQSSLKNLVSEIQHKGSRKPYDCIIGVSGGVDSSWTLYNAIKLGLRPLAVHMDNGWNSELAVNNISNLIDELDVDLHTYVIEWQEYRDLMEAFFAADVIDVELLYDNAMLAVCYEQAKRYSIRYILAGSNTSTEGMRMPYGWSWRDKWDAKNIKSIANWRNVTVSSLPTFSNIDWLKFKFIRHISWVPFLDYLEDYNKFDALQQLERKFGVQPYPYKHYENVFTRFYQGFILPEKFNVDKRKVHLSSLIITGQIERGDALEILKHIPYPTLGELEQDKDYFLKKMGWSESDLNNYINRPERFHDEWETDFIRKWIWPILTFINKPFLKRSIKK